MGAQTCAELRKRCVSFVDVSRLFMTRCGQNVAKEARATNLVP
jgi:hypothetical protein